MFDSKMIKKLRLKHGLSKQQVLNDLLVKHGFSVSRPTWMSWEDGKVYPAADVVAILANYFGVTPSIFYK